MKLIQKYPLHYLGTMTFEIKKSKVIRTYKSLLSDVKEEIDIKNIKPDLVYYKKGNDSWFNVSLFFLFLIIVFSLFEKINDNLSLILMITLASLTLISFLLAFRKQKYVRFDNKQGYPFFHIRLSGKSDKEEEFIECLKKEINKKHEK